jgi:hypothetical protein
MLFSMIDVVEQGPYFGRLLDAKWVTVGRPTLSFEHYASVRTALERDDGPLQQLNAEHRAAGLPNRRW